MVVPQMDGEESVKSENKMDDLVVPLFQETPILVRKGGYGLGI